jgi:outer membrane scaffolding protein for murein synthesis (MipA/OmpV family)
VYLSKTRLAVPLALIALGFAGAGVEGEERPSSDDVKPLWEVGVGGFAGSLPDYPAAGQNTVQAIALPYLVYRGDFWRVGGEENRGAISGRFVKSERFEFDITASAAFPVDSEDNKARRGMPDLDYLFGIGPQLIFRLINEPGHRELDFHLQARAVYSTDLSSIDSRGYVFNPKLSYSHEHLTGLDLRLFSSVGPVFATEALMDYFYEVQPEFATPVRRVYDADAGYLGSNITLGVTKRFKDGLRVLVGTRVGIYSGATNRDSPLFENEWNHSVFAAFAWSFFQSERPAR